MDRPRLSDRLPALVRTAALGGVICVAALLAFHLRRAGHSEGDDFALYLRQARSLFDGDTGAVVADNRFAVLNSDPGFSPIAYPWGWPLLLSPFVHLWEFDYDRLKLVEIAAFCAWLVLLHGIVRRRLGRVVATALVAAIATAPAYLEHTDQLLTEFPHMAMIGVVFWWHDRIRSRSSLIAAPDRDLVVLGLLTVAAFNIRREAVLLVAVIAAMQLADIWGDAGGTRWADLSASVRRSWRALLLPVASFVGGAVAAQLLLPSELLPDNGNSLGFVDDRWRDAPRVLSSQFGLGEQPVVGIAVLVAALAGAWVGLRRRPLFDAPLLLLALLTAVVIGTHPRRIDRYWLQVTPWVLVFVAGAVAAAAQFAIARFRDGSSGGSEPVSERWSRVAHVVAVSPLVALVLVHLVVLPGKISDARDANAAGIVQDGPAHPSAVEMYDAVDRVTTPDAVVAFYRARMLTLLTDRRAFQTHDAERIRTDADYWVQRRDWGFWQPRLDRAEVTDLGLTEVWANDRYVIWCSDCPD